MPRRRSNIPPRTSIGRPRVTGGFSIGSAQPRQAQEPPQSHVVPTDSALAEMRQVYRTALATLAQQLETLLEQAVNATEREFWANEIERRKTP